MPLLAAIFFCALSRAEIIERFRAPVVTQVDGLVRVYADCPSDMRREYQLPVAGFVSGVCRRLYAGEMRKQVKFSSPGIVVHVGDVRTNVTNVVSRVETRGDGTRFTRIYLPAPGHADVRAFTLAAAKGYFLAVKGTVVDDAAAWRALRDADPELRAADDRRDLARWREEGVYTEGRGDEDYLKLQRKILTPGKAPPEDVAVFASRLYLYPPYHGMPFCGRYDRCTFAEAIPFSRRDPFVRYVAFGKMTEIALYGGGRGEKMSAAADAYVAFLRLLAAGESTDRELEAALAAADAKLKGVTEE